MTTPSEIVLQITGAYIEDDLSPKPPLLVWVQAECRNGCFRKTVEECVKKQPEPLRPDLVLVEKVDADKITLRVPGRVNDHESPSTVDMDVRFELNPVTLAVNRIESQISQSTSMS
jgi:hypothetical protein